MTATLIVRDLHLTRGNRAILKGVNLDARAGEMVALMGRSGSGKTTILRVIADSTRLIPDRSPPARSAWCSSSTISSSTCRPSTT